MDRLHPDDMKKLPKWAQRHLEVCYGNINCLARDKAALFRPVLAEDAVVVLPHFHGADLAPQDDQPLNKHQRVKFFPLGNGKNRWHNYIEVGLDSQRSGEVNIHGSGTVESIPHASNSFSVRLEREQK